MPSDPNTKPNWQDRYCRYRETGKTCISHAARKGKEAKDKTRYYLGEPKGIVEVLTLFVVIAYTVVSCQQKTASVTAANAAHDAAVAANGQLKAMRDDGRAWINPVGAGFVPAETPGEIPTSAIIVTYGNSGRQPALSIYNGFKIGVIDAPDQLASGAIDSIVRLKPVARIDWVRWSVWPSVKDLDWHGLCDSLPSPENGEIAYPSTPANDAVTLPIDSSINLHDVVGRKKVLYIEGCFKYTAVAERHVSAFCYYLEPTAKNWNQWVFRNCPVGNHAD